MTSKFSTLEAIFGVGVFFLGGGGGGGCLFWWFCFVLFCFLKK